MRSAIAATLAVTGGLVVANMLGVAAAEAPTATPARTVSVQGVASVPIPQGADVAVADSTYREGMAAAITDGNGKAEVLASKAGATLGSVQSIVEDGGEIGCSGEAESGYVGYDGEQPDFGWGATGSAGRVVAAPERAPLARHLVKKSKRPSAKKASAVSCKLSAQVLLVYAIS